MTKEYEALKAYGFSAAKAAEIELDAKRGDAFAYHYVLLVMDAARTKTKHELETKP